jgi:hypothetical protein
LWAKEDSGPCVPVFVTSSGAQGGFTDPNKGNQDSMKNLTSSLKDKKAVCVVSEREKARIVLEVMSREKAQATYGPLGPARDCTVRVKFILGDFETEMSASAAGGTMASGGAWSKAAGKVAKQVEEWVIANREKLDAQTTPAATAPVAEAKPAPAAGANPAP